MALTAEDGVEERSGEQSVDKALLGNGSRVEAVQQLDQRREQEEQQLQRDPGSDKTCTQLQRHGPLLTALCLTHVCIGMASALPGSSLMQLAKQVAVSLGNMGFWFTVKSVSSCLLALVTSFLFVRLPAAGPAKSGFLAAFNLLCACALLGAALTRSSALALSLAGLLGAGHGALETANGILVIRVFGSHGSRPVLHSLHFSTALGGLTAPLLLQALVTPETGNATAAATAEDGNATGAAWTAGVCGRGESGEGSSNGSLSAAAAAESPLQLIGPYSVLFALQTAVAAGLLALAVRRYSLLPPAETPAPPTAAETAASTAEEVELPPLPLAPSMASWRRGCLIALTVLFYFAAVGGENIFWSVAVAYGACAPALRLSPSGAAAMHTAFFGGFLAGRGLGVALSHWARPTFIMLAHLGGCLAALAALCLSTTPWLTYAGTAAFGLFVSVLYATGVTWLEQRMDVAGPVACSWLIGGQLGISSLPAVAGHLLVSPSAGPAAVMQLALGALALAVATFLAMLALTVRKKSAKLSAPRRPGGDPASPML